MNTIGRNLCFTSFGESHGEAIGGVLDGFPARFTISVKQIYSALKERAGEGVYGVSPRAAIEPDEIEWLSGVIEYSENSEKSESSETSNSSLITLGSPIAFIIRNRSVRPQDYAFLKEGLSTLNSKLSTTFRPAHADEVYYRKYGILHTGGGRASGRETVSRVVAGSITEQWLRQEMGITITAKVETIGGLPYPSKEADELLQTIHNQHDSIGATISCTIENFPHIGNISCLRNLQNLGDPIFDKLTARLAHAIMTIGGTTGITFEPDAETKPASIRNQQPHGIIGGIATGQPITFYVTFHATPSIGITGRHDLCFALRTPAVVRAMTALTLMDLALFA